MENLHQSGFCFSFFEWIKWQFLTHVWHILNGFWMVFDGFSAGCSWKNEVDSGVPSIFPEDHNLNKGTEAATSLSYVRVIRDKPGLRSDTSKVFKRHGLLRKESCVTKFCKLCFPSVLRLGILGILGIWKDVLTLWAEGLCPLQGHIWGTPQLDVNQHLKIHGVFPISKLRSRSSIHCGWSIDQRPGSSAPRWFLACFISILSRLCHRRIARFLFATMKSSRAGLGKTIGFLEKIGFATALHEAWCGGHALASS